MGTPSTVTVQRYADTIYSDDSYDPDRRAKPPESDWRAARDFRSSLVADPPGAWGENRTRQVEHFRSVPYIAIRAIMDLVGGAATPLMRRNKKPTSRTTFGPSGAVAHNNPERNGTPERNGKPSPGKPFSKAVALSQQEGRDEEYTPFEDYDHPLARMIRSPNPNESMGELLAKMVLQNRLTGVGPIWAVGSEARPDRPVELWALRTPFMYPIYQRSQTYPNGAWRINPYRAPGWFGALPTGLGAAGAILAAEDVKRFVDPHPIIDWDGWSPLTAGAVQLDVFDAVEVSRKSAMDRGLNLDVLIIAPGMQKEQVETLKDGMESRHMGADRARRLGVVAPPQDNGPGNKFAIEQLGSTPKDMDYESGWEQTLKFVLALFGVPPIVAGLGESGSYAEGYAARQQFYDRQEDYLNRIAVWFTREFLRPWESYPGEFELKIKPRPIDDKELKEKQYAADVDILTVNQRHALRDRPPVEGGDVPAELYTQWLASKILPQPEMPGEGMGEEMMGDAGGAEGDPNDDGQDVPDEMAAAALEELGVPGDEGAGQLVGKAGQYDEAKHKRDHGKFSRTQGSGAKLSQSQYDRHAERLKGENGAVELDHPRHGKTKIRSGNDLREFHQSGGEIPAARPASAPQQQQQQQQQRPAPPPIPQRVAQVSQRAKASPAVKEQLARAHEWADRMAEQHADRVAQHLGIDRASAKHVLASTIKMLCDRALRGEGDEQSQSFTGAGGQKLKVGVKKKQIPGSTPGRSGASGPPRPANPQGQGSLAPRKAMTEGVGSEGGYLVPPASGKKRKKRGLRRVLATALKGLGADESVREKSFLPHIIHMPQHEPPPPPVINNYINVPEQAAPVVNAPVTVNIPEQPVQPAPVVTVNVPEQVPVVNAPVTVNVPKQDAPNVTVNVPEQKPVTKVSQKIGDRWVTTEEVDE